MNTHDENVLINVNKANAKLDEIQGNHPTQVVEAHMAIATVYMLGALVNAVQDLTDEIRKIREGT